VKVLARPFFIGRPDDFQYKLLSTLFAYMIPGMILAGLIGIFKRDVENWIVRKLCALIHGQPEPVASKQGEFDLDVPPCCPECRRPMAKRTARKGERRGTKFSPSRRAGALDRLPRSCLKLAHLREKRRWNVTRAPKRWYCSQRRSFHH
jgi:hypothetical protein